MKKLYLLGGLAALTLSINAQITDKAELSRVPASLERCEKALVTANPTAQQKGPGACFGAKISQEEFLQVGVLWTILVTVMIGS